MESNKNNAQADKQYTAKEVIEIIEKMDNSERWDLLEAMYELYYNTRSEK